MFWKLLNIFQLDFRKEDEIDKELHISGFCKEDDSEELDSDNLEYLEEFDDIQMAKSLGDLKANDVPEESVESIQMTKSLGDLKANDVSEESVESICENVECLEIAGKDQFDEPVNSRNLDAVSNFSYVSHSTTSTIAPEIIHSRVKKAITKRSSAIDRKRCLAKGEASAVARQRKENKDVIKEYLNPSSVWG